jgi:hypothetical protein
MGAVDDDPQTGEHRAQRDEQADGAERHERQVVDRRVEAAEGVAQRGRDHESEEDRSHQRDDDLPRRVRAERDAAAREGGECGEVGHGRMTF